MIVLAQFFIMFFCEKTKQTHDLDKEIDMGFKLIDGNIVKFEQTEIKNISDTMAMLKLQKSLSKPEEYNSDEDSLNGWDYNDEFDP